MTNKHDDYIDSAPELLSLMLGVNAVGIFLMDLNLPDDKQNKMKEECLKILERTDTYFKRKSENMQDELNRILEHPAYWNSIEKENGDKEEFEYTDNIVSLFRDKR